MSQTVTSLYSMMCQCTIGTQCGFNLLRMVFYPIAYTFIDVHEEITSNLDFSL